ncbi:DNA helicase [Mycobacterium intermedium]|uniref:DNA helicase n=1 Tax=Mycobacterium intermedium TaxID=28445 RepID=A0A1E3SN02_MYCIE|nr:DNA helicase [Mycobacterium intermedium]OPE48908.1 DNA helicase [Mycobacterium intermedium]ORB05174.1 DNA helicase [Mycobacterium intermedium]
MDEVDYHEQVGEALGILIGGLRPFVERVLTEALPPGVSWTELLRRKDIAAGRRVGMYQERDLSLMLRAMTERLGDVGFPFSQHLSRQAQNYASELRDIRNRWAHNEAFSAADAYRAIDTIELLLRAIGEQTQAEQVAELKHGVSPALVGRGSPEPEPAEKPDAEPFRLATPPQAVAKPPVPPAAAHRARIEIHAVADLSYPMAHCRIPVIDHISIEYSGGEVRSAVVEVDVVSAEGSLGGPQQVFVDLAAHKPTILQTVDLKLDPASMLRVEDQGPGAIRVVLRDAAGNVLAEESKDVTILAANQWKATPLQLALEMLAAHVQPNSAAIRALMTDVSDRLLDATGNSSIDGYQSENPERVDAIAQAVFEAMRARDIRYAEPPASWGTDGQKVRTPAEVLDGRLGTCLDTTVTMAAALEEAGINSTLWVLKGHAFLGYWRSDAALDMISSTEVVDVANQVDLGHIGLIETTMVTQAHAGCTFADAARAPRMKFLAGDLSEILGVTDIRQARNARIFPLPSRTTDAEGNVIVTQYEPGAGPTIAPYVARPGTETPTAQDDVPRRVSQWKNALLDLSLRNKLINYTERAGYRIEVPGPALGRFEDAVNAGAKINLLASDVIPRVDTARGIRFGRDLPERERELLLAEKHSAYIDITEAAYKSKLRYLAYKAKTIVEETGANNLYLAFGMLSWHFADRDLRSPLVLVPVTLTTANRGERYVLTIDETGMSTPNYCLVEKLRVAFGLEIPDLLNPTEDASGIDLVKTFDAVRHAVARAGLHFRVEESVHLAVLQFAKYPLWKDLDESWKQLSRNSLVAHLIESPMERFRDPVDHIPPVDLDELGTRVPVPADSSQLTAVAEAVGGRTFVLEGPPGTGKSQTITNLLAHAMATGRRVLFVAEKRAALDVVKKRLEEVGLGELSLDLHNKSARPAAVREQIKVALELHISHDKEKLRTNSQVAESSRRSLARYAERLHERNAAGLSLYTARSSELAADHEVPPLEVPRSLVASGSPETFKVVGDVLRSLPEKADLARPGPGHPWGFIDTPSPQSLDAQRIYQAAVEFDQALADLQQRGLGLEKIARAGSAAALAAWAALADAPRYPLEGLDQLQSDAWKSALATIRTLAKKLQAARPNWLAVASPAAMDLDIPAIHQAAVAADESGFFGRKKRRRAVLAMLSDALVVAPETVPLKTLSQITGEMAETFAAVSDLRARVATIPLMLVGDQWNPLIPEHVVELEHGIETVTWILATLSASSHRPHGADLREYYANTAVGSFAQPLDRLAIAWNALTTVTGASPAQQQAWAQQDNFITRWWATRDARKLDSPASIERWVDLLRHIEPLRAAGMDAARSAILTGQLVAEDAALAFDRGVAAASIAERLEASALNAFDIEAHNKAIRRFTTSTQEVRQELRRAIPAELLSRRRFNADASSGQVGGLRRQLERRRGGMSIRALMENFGDLITDILPCTLMSPDSVARFFPARPGLFDIVVFDEASQIRVADAVGAMGRAKSVVVVGDSKQMPPTSFAEASATIDEDEDYNPDVVIDEESILTECVQAQVPRHWLSWHYRSQDESLIAFSNYHYYEGRLASFPAPLTDTAPAVFGHGISLVRVNGHFDRTGRGKTLRTNRVEAERIVEDVRQRFWASPDVAPSLGIVTFNAPQRDLIENLLRDAGDDRLLAALDEPDGLFVKNLENVQGDERDTILFSVAFSANEKGVVPLNFGPLSRPGGERRLNVAVTRARREVVLYASFDPSELRAEETTQLGTKHLKAYLEMAARGVESVTSGGRRQPVIDRHRDDIAEALRREGLPVSTDVGLSDFRVDLVIFDPDQPEQPLVAALLDGTEWYARKTVADRDGLPIDVLKNLMHWPAVERIWLPEWLDHRSQALARLRKAVDEAKQRLARGEVEPDPARRPPEPKPETTTKPQEFAPLKSASASVVAPVAPRRQERPKHPNIQTYREWVPTIAGGVNVLDELPSPGAKTRVRAVVQAVIEAEAPIHRDRLARLVAGAFMLNRVSEDRKRAIQRVVPSEYVREGGENFYWPLGVDPRTWRIVRCPRSGESRRLEEISLVEIGNAMMIAAEEAGGIDTEELKREALNMFGGKRITQAISARLEDALKHALAQGYLVRSGSVISCQK